MRRFILMRGKANPVQPATLHLALLGGGNNISTHQEGIMPITNKPLVSLSGNRLITTSLAISQHFDRKHQHILRAIDQLECSPEFAQSNFGRSSYSDGNQRKRPMHEITRDGFVYLCMGFTGAKADKWKEAYINTFNAMEARLRDPATALESSTPTSNIEVNGTDYMVLQERNAQLQAELLQLYRDKVTVLQTVTAKPMRKALTNDEKQEITKLTAMGVTASAIAKRIQRNPSSVRSYLRQSQSQGQLTLGGM